MAGFTEPIDPKIREQVTDLVEKGITQLSVIKKCLKEYIQNDLFHDDCQPESYSYFVSPQLTFCT